MIDTKLLDKIVEGQSFKPSDLETVFYIFWDKGIGYTEWCNYPIPYIISILNTHNYVKRLEEKEMKKAHKKR
jgi:hypothetical protein